MDNTEEKNAQSCTPDEACCCDTVASTKEEISAALDNLVDLIKRYDGRAIFSAFLEVPEERKTRHILESSSSVFQSERMNFKVYGWTSAFGYLLKAGECFEGNVKTMGEGVRLFLEQQQKNENEGSDESHCRHARNRWLRVRGMRRLIRHLLLTIRSSIL